MSTVAVDPQAGTREREPIAVVGMGCRVPGADNVEEYWSLLVEGRSAISAVPPDRWQVEKIWPDAGMQRQRACSSWGSFLTDGDSFDAALFGISEREAERMDPQQGLVLEVAWQAMEHGGIAPGSLRNRNVGVYIGLTNSDYDRKLCRNLEALDIRAGTGTGFSISANRISYTFGLRGPSFAVDAACASSLLTIHLACQGLWMGETEMAFAGGTHLILAPEKTVTFSASGLLAADGQCRCFSQESHGYVRGEGAGVVLLKPWSAAVRDGNRILALVLGSSVNHNGASNGLSAPNGPAQRELIQTALERARVRPEQVGYVEAHGSGTRLGDEIEVRALSEVLSRGRGSDNPLVIGSSKGNFGHLEAAAGVASFIKSVLILQHGVIPATLGSEPLSPQLANMPLARIATRTSAWGLQGGDRYAAVSCLSFGGANAHAVVRNAPPEPILELPGDGAYHVLTFSANSPDALTKLRKHYAEFLLAPDSGVSFADVCFTAVAGREALPYRVAVIARNGVEASRALNRCDAAEPLVFQGRAPKRAAARVVWVFGDELREIQLQDAPEAVHEACAPGLHNLRKSESARVRAVNVLGTLIASLLDRPRLLLWVGEGGMDIAPPLSGWLSGAPQSVRPTTAGDPVEAWLFGASEHAARDALRAQGLAPARLFRVDSQLQGVIRGIDLARLLGHAQVAGVSVDWTVVHGVRRRVPLPHYPFERVRYWRTAEVC